MESLLDAGADIDLINNKNQRPLESILVNTFYESEMSSKIKDLFFKHQALRENKKLNQIIPNRKSKNNTKDKSFRL